MAPHYLKSCHIVAVGKWKDEYTAASMKKWIETRGGSFGPSCNDKTSHLVVTEKMWREGNKHVKEARELIQGGQNIKIVTYDWLDDILTKNYLLSENKYLCTKVYTAQEHSSDGESSGSRCGTNLETTNGLNHKRRKGRKGKSMEDGAGAAANSADGQSSILPCPMKPDIAAVFKSNAQKARNDILSTNHHIYVDEIGFTYDITVTKVDALNNRNLRYCLTIYESHSTPKTYAVNAQSSGTGLPPQNKVLVAIGANWDTAFGRFKKCFKETTHIAWEERVELAAERYRREHPNRFHIIDSHIKKIWPNELFNPTNFETAPYQYQPPKYGPCGLPYKKVETAKAVAPNPSGVSSSSGASSEHGTTHSRIHEYINVVLDSDAAAFSIGNANGVGHFDNIDHTADLHDKAMGIRRLNEAEIQECMNYSFESTDGFEQITSGCAGNPDTIASGCFDYPFPNDGIEAANLQNQELEQTTTEDSIQTSAFSQAKKQDETAEDISDMHGLNHSQQNADLGKRKSDEPPETAPKKAKKISEGLTGVSEPEVRYEDVIDDATDSVELIEQEERPPA